MKEHPAFAARRRPRSWSVIRLIGPLAASLALLGTPAAHADLVFSVNDVTATAGSTGNTTLEVSLTNTGSVATPEIAAFQFELMVVGASGVMFADVDTSTANNTYIFGSDTSAPPLSYDMFPNTDFTASDLYTTPNAGVTLGAGQTVGLGRVTFDVDPSAGGVVPIIIVPNYTVSVLDPNGDPIGLSDQFVNGSIDVTSAGSVPEPSSLVLALLGIAATCLRRRCHVRRKDRAAAG